MAVVVTHAVLQPAEQVAQQHGVSLPSIARQQLLGLFTHGQQAELPRRGTVRTRELLQRPVEQRQQSICRSYQAPLANVFTK